jgi:hypothetical protein
VVDASAVDVTAVDAAGGTVIVVETEAEIVVGVIHGWIRCESALLRVVRGLRRRMMSLWI